MSRNALVGLILFVSVMARAGDRTLAAQGDYVAQGTNGRPSGHWKLWHLRDGGYRVEETDATNSHIVQVFTFDSKFLPIGFSLTIDPYFKARQRGQNTVALLPLAIVSCRYHQQKLECETDIKGKKSATTSPANQPYVFVPGGFYAFDATWFMTGVIRLLDQGNRKDDAVNVLLMTNVMTDDRIEPSSAIKLTYAGEITADVLGKSQSLTEYEGSVGDMYAWGFGPSVLQVTQGGLVVSVRSKSPFRGGFGIRNYKEYEAWQPHR